MGTVEIYPPSPNWFQASCCAVQQGVLAYAARERVVLMDVATGHVVRMLGSDCGPTAARAAAVALAEHGGRLIATCAHENGAVRLWDAAAGTVLLCGTAAADTPLTSCALCTTTRAENAVVVVGDAHGRLSLWFYADTTTGSSATSQTTQQQGGTARHTIVLCSSNIAVVRACPCDARYFAAVAANGVAALFFVRTVGAPAELCRFAAFDGTCTVQDAQWARDPATGALLLAISARDRVRVFQVENLLQQQQSQETQQASSVVVTVKELATVRVPHAHQQEQQQQKGTNNTRQWAPVAWARCGRGSAATLALLSCDVRGTIAAWILDAAHARLAPAPAALVRFVAGVHTRPVFNLVAAVLPGTDARTVAVSAGMDRTLAVWDCATGRKLWSVATLGGYVYAIDASPLEPRRAYFALGDNTIHSWNLPVSCSSVGNSTEKGSTNSATLYEGRTFWKGLQAKVTCIALHPLLPGVVAYGLDDGRSGVYDVAAGAARPMKGSQHGAVYALAWQCADPNALASHTLWSASVDGTLLAHLGADEQPSRGPKSSPSAGTTGKAVTTTATIPFETLVEHSAWYAGLGEAERAEVRATLLARHSTVAASADGALLCVGNKSGLVCVLARGCVPVRQTRVHTAPVARARWSHAHTRLCATASDDGSVCVLDAAAPAAPPRLLRGGHRGAVYDVAWAPPTAPRTHLLASAGADGAVLLWDASAGTCLATLLRGGRAIGATLAVHWPAALPACILCGGVDQAVRVCRVDVSDESAVSAASGGSDGVPALGNGRAVITVPPEVLTACHVSGVKRPPPSPVPETAPPAQAPATASSKSSAQNGRDTNNSTGEEGDIELFNTTDTRTEAEVLDACSALLETETSNSEMEDGTTPEAATTAPTMGSFISTLVRSNKHSEVLEAIGAATTKSTTAKTHVLVLEGDLPGLAAECGGEGHRMSALELALLPALGRDVWAAGVALYAEQQAAAGHSAVAATCLAALGRVPAAVDVLLRANRHAAALALQAARTPADAALRRRVLAAWAAHHARAGRRLRAAECYAAAGFFSAAAACLEHALVVPGALAEPALRPRIETLLARLRAQATPDPGSEGVGVDVCDVVSPPLPTPAPSSDAAPTAPTAPSTD